MRLWVRLAALMALVSTLPLLITSFRTVQISTREAEASSDAILQREASELATFVETWAGGQGDALRGWMQLYPDLADKGEAQQEALLRSMFVAVPSVVTLVLLDADGAFLVPPVYLTEPPEEGTLVGRSVGSAAGGSALVEHLPISEAVLRARRGLADAGSGAGHVVGSAYAPPERAAVSVPVAVTGPSDPDLVLGAELELGPIIDRLVRERTDASHGVAVVSTTGEALFGSRHPLVDADRLRPLLGTDATFRYRLAAGTPVRGATSPVEDTDWNVVIVEPAWVAERAAYKIRQQTFRVLLVSLALAILIGVVLARTVSEPVGRLRDSALAVARGDYGRRVQVDTSDEIGQLAAAFNHMSEGLEANRREIESQQAEIEAFNRDLQARVEERTRELREAQQRLVQSGQLAAIAQVGAGLAHELNNPLTGILGTAQLLRRKAAGTPAETQLARIEEEAERCRDVVAAMLRFSAAEVDPAEHPVVDLGDLLREVAGLVRGPFRQRGVDLVLEEPPASLRVKIDPVLGSRILAQVLQSLRAGLGEGAGLTIRAGRRDEDVVVILRPDREIAVGASRDDWMASGMGLWVARRLLDRIGGRLEEPEGGALDWHLVLPGAG